MESGALTAETREPHTHVLLVLAAFVIVMAGMKAAAELVVPFLMKTAISLVTGALVAIWLALIGVDFPVLWRLLTFLLKYVPSFGSFLAGVPPVLLALLQLGPVDALLAAAGISAINIALDKLVAPRFMGKGLGLSTLVVFVSLIFWGWILGPEDDYVDAPAVAPVNLADAGTGSSEPPASATVLTQGAS